MMVLPDAMSDGTDEVTSAHTYVHNVYRDAVGYLDSYRMQTNQINIDVYAMIDQLSRPTGDRLRDMGAHRDSPAWKFNMFALENFGLSILTVPTSWMNEWNNAISLAKSRGVIPVYREPAKVIAHNVVPSIKGGVKFGVELGAPVLIFGLIALDAYSSGKSAVRKRMSR